MKSCLKNTPPLTPLLNTPNPSPFASGNVSPTSCNASLPRCRKAVSFCPDLEEFFEADDWDRTPAPVAPKLSYQDILELKQIMNSLPRAPQCSTFREACASSVPHLAAPSPPVSSSCPSSTFPVSRWASAPSLTPSRWKNRDASQQVDPQILPYLDSVPIQLLPLLPPTSVPAGSGCYEQPCHPFAPSNAATTTPAVLIKVPIPVPMLTPPPSLASSASPSPVSSPSSSSPSTPKRQPNLAFVPLLPVKEEPKAPAPAPVVAPRPPMRKFNMTFVPLLPPEDPQPPTPTVTPPNPIDAVELTPQNEAPPEEEDALQLPSPPYMPLSLGDVTRAYMSTPSLSSASDTDTESETPSVSSPCPSSPLDDDDATLSHYFAEKTDGEVGTATSHNPYFPCLPDAPPFAASLPSPAPSVSSSVIRKLKLQALPSPALQPPSPFSLYPTVGEEQREAVAEVTSKLDAATPLTKKRPFLSRPSSLANLSASAASPCALGLSPGISPELTIERMRMSGLGRPSLPHAELEETFLLAPSFSRRY